MATMLETPSRVWRRIEAIEDRDMPSLPSLPAFEDSADVEQSEDHDELDEDLIDIASPMHSTPATTSAHHTAASTIRPPSSTSSTARFATSIASRSNKSSLGLSSSRGMSTRRSHHDSFNISMIPSLPNISAEPGTMQYTDEEMTDEEHSKDSVPEVYLPPDDDSDGERDLSLTEALQSVSRTSSPPYPLQSFDNGVTPKKNYDYSVSLKSEPKPSPFDKYRNVALRKSKAAVRTRTPSLSRTGSSQASSPANSTPQSSRSIALPRSSPESPLDAYTIPLPRSATASPAIYASRSTHEQSVSDEDRDRSLQETGIRSMDITDVHISPPRFDDTHSENEQDPQRDEEAHTTADEQEQNGSQSEQEPTFSSDGGPTPYAQNYSNSSPIAAQSPGPLSSAFSSPAQSVAFTPTPAFPRPRARFNIPIVEEAPNTPEQPPSDDQQSEHEQSQATHDQDHEEDPLTPHTRRRSFLLSVINSTARPRMKFPTPHPRNNHLLTTPSIAESTPGGPGINVGSRTSLQTAFAGVTPRPRPGTGRNARASHPLAQTVLPSPGASDSDSTSPASGSGSGSAPVSRRSSLGAWGATPAPSQLSPYDGAGDRASFISTASSHDLTTHHRVNTSFDPSMGFGAAAGQGVGRFNAGKLNNYLHGLNRRLQEENEALMERLRKAEEEKKLYSASIPVSAAAGAGNGSEGGSGSGRRLSGGGRRASAGGTTLGNVAEDVGGEGWVEEKAELEDMVDALREEVTRSVQEKEEAEKALEEEKGERARDKERWRDRMAEVEQGVEVIIKELEKKAEDAEKRTKDVEDGSAHQVKEMEKRLVEAEAERDLSKERAEKAERVLESGKELGGELRDANERVEKIMGDLRNANAQIKELEEEVMRSDGRIDDLEKDLREDRDAIASLEEELSTKADELAEDRARIRHLEQEIRKADEELQSTKEYVVELEEGAESAIERIEKLEDELAAANDQVHTMTVAEEQAQDRMEKLEADAQKAQELARQMEEALEEAEKKMLEDEDELNELKNKVASMEREREREANRTQESSRNPFNDGGPTDAELEALENELDAANKEIGRLTTLLNQSPARKAMEKARDTKVELLEKEREELLERNRALRLAMNEINTPNKVMNASGISPIHRQVLSMSMRTPRTPGAPLRDLSWLNNTTADPTVAPLIAEIHRLQQELDRANESIDNKFDELEVAGHGVVGLTKRLEDARSKISTLEEEIARLTRREDRRLRCLERTRCQKCRAKVNFSALAQMEESTLEISRDDLPSEPPTPPTRTSEALKANLQSVNSHLESMKKEWEQERRKLLGEKAVLQDATQRLNAQIQSAKEEAKKATESGRAGEKTAAGVQGELDKAKRVIAELEANLKSERSHLRVVTTEQNRIQREKADIMNQLQRTESDMDDVKHQLQKFKKENHNLEKELRENVNADQKARLLEGRVAENAETIEQLREERVLLVTDHKELQRRFSEISEQANRLREEYGASSTSHDNRRHQLDLHLLEIADLRRALSDQAEELQRAKTEKGRISAEKNDVARTVEALEADLRRVKKNAEAFDRDLKLLRADKEKLETKHKEELTRAERTRKQTQTQIRVLNEQLETQRAKASRAKDEMKNHVCAADDQQLSVIKIQHSKECKGLMVQIRYLKASFTRESSFRSNLVNQKAYLLVLLSKLEKSEQTIFAAIARIGYPVTLPTRVKKPRKLKTIVMAVVFISRAARAGSNWREQSSSRQAVLAALQEVRQRRATVSA
ncbi:Spindle pole body protein pcp1 [Hypsizygus marmoreus]|uniref:Spindle pole body protein pcp1 n=1 Tax=Hypsizygus marmoreus TaxID=39966 RepID=A0A369J4L2_HYPMA|nr:Spindle pole body protein pcp1 [Hypsizygus marmoreus]